MSTLHIKALVDTFVLPLSNRQAAPRQAGGSHELQNVSHAVQGTAVQGLQAPDRGLRKWAVCCTVAW